MFKYLKKRLIAVSLGVLLFAGTLTGCGNNTKIVVTSGLSGDQLFKIGSSDCTIPEIMVYLTSFYNQYTQAYGEEMWQYDFGGMSLEEHVKDVVLSKMAQIKIMNLMADEYGIKLDAEEKEWVKKAADIYYRELTDALKKEEAITLEVVEKVYKEYTLANKVYEDITKAADMEISDDEARTVTVQTIYFPNSKTVAGKKTEISEKEMENLRNKANEAMSRIHAGERFEIVAESYNEDSKNIKNYARGEAEAEFEELLFSMDTNEVIGPVEASDGIYIVKCISTMDYEATKANKIVLAEKRKREAFSKAYGEMAAKTHSQFRDKLWEELTLNEEIHQSNADFFAIYREYVKRVGL